MLLHIASVACTHAHLPAYYGLGVPLMTLRRCRGLHITLSVVGALVHRALMHTDTPAARCRRPAAWPVS